MDILGIKKPKKEVSNETKVKRLKIILGVIAAGLALVIIIPDGKKNHTGENTVTEQMDASLDSLISANGFKDFKVYYKGVITSIEEQNEKDLQEKLEDVKFAINVVQMSKTMTDKEKMTNLDALIAEKENLEKSIEENSKKKTKEYYQSRRIRFSTADGKKYTFFQDMHCDGMRIDLLTDITNDEDDYQKELKKLESESNN